MFRHLRRSLHIDRFDPCYLSELHQHVDLDISDSIACTRSNVIDMGGEMVLGPLDPVSVSICESAPKSGKSHDVGVGTRMLQKPTARTAHQNR